MKSVDVNWSTCIDFNKNNGKGDPTFKAGDLVRILKFENIFCKRLRFKLVRRGFCDCKN